MLTFIGKFRLTYIIKEKAERLTKGVDQHVVVHIANRFGYKLKIDGCNGNDFEEMIEDIKQKEFIWRNCVGSYNKWFHGNNRNFNFIHFASLRTEKQRKVESKDSVFAKQFTSGIPDFPKPQRLPFDIKTESDRKYRLSICTRRTFLITNCKHSCISIFGCKYGRKKCKACFCQMCTKQINFY